MSVLSFYRKAALSQIIPDSDGTKPGLEGGHDYQEMMDTLCEESFPLKSRSVMTPNDHGVLTFTYPLGEKYTVVAYYLSAAGTDGEETTTIYAYAFWPPGSRASTPEYVCVGPTYISQDGEYRASFLWYPDFQKVYSYALKEGVATGFNPIDRLYDLVMGFAAKGDIGFATHAYPAGRSPENETRKVLDHSDTQRLQIKLLIAVLFRSNSMKTNVNLNPNFSKTLRSLLDAASNILCPSGPPSARDLVVKTRLGFHNGAPRPRVKCGIKLIPLTEREREMRLNPRGKGWKELFLTELMSQLKTNFIAPTPPLFVGSTVLVGVDEHVFENPSMVALYRASDDAREQLDGIRNARAARAAYADDPHGDAAALAEVRETLTANLLSDECLLIATEWVGPTIIRYFDEEGPAAPLEDDAFVNLMFVLVYGLMAMHRYAVHADLHTNNITVSSRTYSLKMTDVCSVFIVGPDGQRDTYLVPHGGLTPHIIDYSKCVVGPGARTRIESQVGKLQADAFYTEQKAQTIEALLRWGGEYAAENSTKLENMFYSRPDDVYEALKCVDYMALGKNVGVLVGDNVEGSVGSWTVRQTDHKVCLELYDTANDHFFRWLRCLVEDAPPPPPAGRAIVNKIFNHLQFSKWDPEDIAQCKPVDAFSLVAEHKYDAENPPPWLQPEQLVHHSGKKMDKLFSRGALAQANAGKA
jgi:hypothetical protein